MRRLIALLFVAASAQGTLAGAPDAGLVRVDAIVTDARGNAVPDLGIGDFGVSVMGVPLPLESVRFASADEPRHFAIFLDEFHVSDGPAVARARALLTEFVERQLGPADLVTVVKPLDSLANVTLTSDRGALLLAIASFEGRKGDYRPRSDFERNYIAGTPDRIEAVRSQIATSALAALAAHLGGQAAGRKTIIVVTEGFAPAPRRRDVVLPTIESVVRAANLATASIYPIHPRAFGAVPEAAGETGSMLRALAEDTNGRTIFTPADLQSGMAHVMSDASGYYMLSFKPADPKGTGTFHELELRVNRPRLAVRARKGYWSAAAGDLFASQVGARPIAAGRPAVLTRASPLIRPWFGVARGTGGNLRLNFVWEPVARVPGDRSLARSPSTIAIKAVSPEGATVFEGDVDAKASRAVFETAPGRLRVELAIRDVDARLLDTDVRDVIVGALAGPVEVGTAEVLRSRSAREYSTLALDPHAVPVASREFSRTERLLIRIPVYGSGEGFAVTASLRSAMGAELRRLAVAAAPGDGVHQVDLPLANLPAGEYSVGIVAKSSEGEARETVRLRVTP